MEQDLKTPLLPPEEHKEAKEEEKLSKRLWDESRKLWVVAGPAIFTRFSTFGVSIITQAFIGHVGSTELAAYALVSTVLFRFANGILLGMASALETLCGQAFGAKQHHMLGIYLQRSWIVLMACAILLLPVFLFTTPILRFLGQEESIAKMAGIISLWFIPIVFSFIFSFTLQMYLQSQSKNIIITYVAAISLALHVFLSWLLVVKFSMGVTGAMSSMILAMWIPVIGQFAFVLGGGCPETWKGFSWSAFSDLWAVVRLSLSSGAMVCVRVANELGAGSAKAAKFSIIVATSTSLIIGSVLFVGFLIVRGHLAYIFTDDLEVARAVADLSPLLAFSILMNSVQPVLSGVAIGAGWQSIVAYVNIACYYLIGIPLGVVLGYLIGFQVKGIWIGMILGTATQTFVLVFITWRTNWDKQVALAQARLNKWALPVPDGERVA